MAISYGGSAGAEVTGIAEAVVYFGLANEQGGFAGFSERLVIAPNVEAPLDIDIGDFNRDGQPDAAVLDREGLLIFYGASPSIPPNDSLDSARDLGEVVHLLDIKQTIVPGREEAYFKMVVPTEAISNRDEVIDFSALFEHQEGAGLAMELLDADGDLIASGSRLRITASQGETLYLRVFGLEDSSGEIGRGAFTTVTNVLPQVVAAEPQALLPGVNDAPGGPTTSIVISLQGDRLEPATAQNPANYHVLFLGADGVQGTADDEMIAIGGPGIDLPVVLQPRRQCQSRDGTDVSSGHSPNRDVAVR